MKLADIDIRTTLAEGLLRIDPPPTEREIGATSIDLHLGTTFRVFKSNQAAFVDLIAQYEEVECLMELVILSYKKIFYLHPGEFALGITHQSIILPHNIVGRLDGRSSLARVGLMVHATAHTIDPGWNGYVTLELFNCGKLPLGIRPGIRICALGLELLISSTSKPYADQPCAKYKSQDSPLPSLLDNFPSQFQEIY